MPVNTIGPEEQGNRPQLYKLIFDQNLDEVHLLIDFVSGRADRSLTTLTIPSANDPNKPMASREIIKAIADMRFPPGGSDAVNADNAAILLLAKDRLSALAAPTRGLTIAYTAMFIDAEVKTWVARFWDWLLAGSQTSKTRRRPPTALREPDNSDPNQATTSGSQAAARQDQPEQDTRVDLAIRAFPTLQLHARRFRRWRDALAMFTIFWLLLTALAYWDAGLGRSALERLDQNWKGFTDELKDNPALLRCPDRQPADVGSTADPKANVDVVRAELACRRHQYHGWMGETAVVEVQRVFRCEDMSWFSEILHVWCWHWLLSGDPHHPHPDRENSPPKTDTAATPGPGPAKAAASAPPEGKEPSQELKDNATYWQIATSTLSVFTSYILPMMFALLGTLIGSFRAILNRVRDSELAPRDFVRMMLGIPTGLVAGVAVGLFLSPSSAPVQGEGGLSGQLTLTASGLGFLAGYASQSFFTYLDNVVATVFPNTVPSNRPPPRQPEPGPV
jgi:hypothetical protein